MKKQENRFTTTAPALMVAALILTAPAAAAQSGAKQKMSATEFRNSMGKLWEDHFVSTRLYIVSARGKPAR